MKQNLIRSIKDASIDWAADNIAVVMAAVWLLTGAAICIAYQAGCLHGRLVAHEKEVAK